MASIKRKTIVRELPKNAKIKTVRRRANKSDYRKYPELSLSPRSSTITEQVAVWVDRSGESQQGVVFEKDGCQKVRIQSAHYYAKYRDGEGIVREVPTGCKDKTAAKAVLNELIRRAELVKAQLLSPEQDRVSDFQAIPLANHLNEYIAYLRIRNVHSDRIKTTEVRLNESAAACSFRYLRDLSHDRLQRWLTEQVRSKRKMSASVYNGYVQLWISFGNWCIGKRLSGKRSNMNGERGY